MGDVACPSRVKQAIGVMVTTPVSCSNRIKQPIGVTAKEKCPSRVKHVLGVTPKVASRVKQAIGVTANTLNQTAINGRRIILQDQHADRQRLSSPGFHGGPLVGDNATPCQTGGEALSWKASISGIMRGPEAFQKRMVLNRTQNQSQMLVSLPKVHVITQICIAIIISHRRNT